MYHQYYSNYIIKTLMPGFLGLDQIQIEVISKVSGLTLHKRSSFFNSSVAYVTFKEDIDKMGQ